nr:serine/arginine repetitive matrix protein 1-like [Ipomoea batatas]GME02622.1 serine/arginine repetitive matrix protein 1-like [Ipomoea batatas]
MGCCVSTAKGSTADQQQQRHRYPLPDPAKNDRAPPPVDEETVKEVVLSETPVSKPLALQVPLPAAEIELDGGDRRVVPPTAVVEEIVSEPSELCSFTESISTTATERRDDDGEVNQRSPARGPPRKRRSAGDLAGGRDRSFRSPARRSAPSPEKRKPLTSSRAGQNRPMASQRRNVGPQNGAQRHSVPARRSRSPVTHREAVDTRPNVRNKSPAVAVSESARSPAESAENRGDNKVEKPNDGASEETGESLENPLVSLECFIFL